MTKYNYGSYLQMTMFFKVLCSSISCAKSGKYKLTMKDTVKGYYFTVSEQDIKIRVPYRALFGTNNKLGGIPSINFVPALNCPSRANGQCQLCDPALCYARSGEIRGGGKNKGIYTKNGFLKMNSYYSSYLSETFFKNATYDDLLHLSSYINEKEEIKVIRFNKSGDFKNNKDILKLLTLAVNCPKTIFYGYTARDDLNIDLLCEKNIFTNGSNKKYTNRFETVSIIEEFIHSPYSCYGACKNCRNCYSLKNKTIKCFIHGNYGLIKPIINNSKNICYLNEILIKYGINGNITAKDNIIQKAVMLISEKKGVTALKKDIHALKYLIKGGIR